MAPISNIVQLRQLLAERFPNVPSGIQETPGARGTLATGIRNLDEQLSGGLPRGAVTEIVGIKVGCGNALLISALIHQCAAGGQWLALVDGQDTFDPDGFSNAALARLLWVRCQTTTEALKAADLIIRDGNLTLVLLDFTMNPLPQLRKIPATTWYRFQRLAAHHGSSLLVLTPRPLVACAPARLLLKRMFSLNALQQPQEQLRQELEAEWLTSESVNTKGQVHS